MEKRINSRRKGHQYERDVANLYRGAGFTAKRGLQSRGGGEEVADVVLEEVDWFIECKNTVRMSTALNTALKRAEVESHGVPSVVHIKMPGKNKNQVVISEELWLILVARHLLWLKGGLL